MRWDHGKILRGDKVLSEQEILDAIGNKRLHWVVDNANQQPMIITPAPSGVGLCLNF